MAVSFGRPPVVLSLDDRPAPVTDQLLKRLGLDREYHQCTYVDDGDTVTLESLGPIRFLGVDTPEKNHPMLPIQFMARESSAFTREL
jgi:endonuclease YncB( thermonuclease family)